jgi:hypothetical protein
MNETKELEISNICLSINYQISKIEEKHYIICSHKNSNKDICLNLSYQLWMLKVQKTSLCENNFTVIKK